MQVDLRSDTVTRPTAGMRAAMLAAEVGDDVFEDDPTVNLLQERAAALLGKEAALFMPSGTMSNSAAIKVHTRPGDEILMDTDGHSMRNEAGMPAIVSQALTRQFSSRSGVPDSSEIEAAIRSESLHEPGTALIILENTHNMAGGTVVPLETVQVIRDIARQRGVRMHLDGARLFNAVIASGTSAADFAACFNSVTFCLSKGLGCPVGSVLCGSADFISRARRVRKMLGGGLRQVGFLAAAGLYALENNIDRLAEDHRRAQTLAAAIYTAPGITVDRDTVQTNMVFFGTASPAARITALLREQSGVLAIATGSNRVRMVTHLDVDDEQIEHAGRAVQSAARCLQQA